MAAATATAISTLKGQLQSLRLLLPPVDEELERWERHRADPVRWISENELFQNKQGEPLELDPHQQEILRSKERRTIVCCHRQWGKSSVAGLMVLHKAIFYPRSLCLLVAPSLRQSSELFRKVMDALDLSPRERLLEDTKLSLKMANGSRILALPGSEKTTRGFTSPDIIVIDEAGKSSDELFAALRPMLISNPEARLILLSTPNGRRGFFFDTWSRSSGWHKLMIKASENPRIDPELLEIERREMTSGEFAREYLCSFEANERSLFHPDVISRMFVDMPMEADVY